MKFILMFFFIIYQFIIFSYNLLTFKSCFILQHLEDKLCFLLLFIYESFKQLDDGI
ncbi:hypothetical protein HMPREF2533_02615 [Bacteroides fragilis]|nr:hypothetical protein HMPREF2530_02615 [Bacteroides fragilis]KXU45087.1 hypothetical protein HMPREF2533_02615 [Bacteroides fragilis]